MTELLDDGLADKTIRDYVCSICWGHLIKLPAEGRKGRVECARHGEETPGYVTKFYANKRLAESRVEKLDVRENLRGLHILPPSPVEKETVEELMKDLGF